MSCRQVMLIAAVMPIVIFILLFFVSLVAHWIRKSFHWCPFRSQQIPESPHWLLSRHRATEAEKSLQWLRGWVSPAAIQEEFKALQRYHKQSSACIACVKQGLVCPHPPSTFIEQCRDLMRKRVLKPALLLLLLSIFSQMGGMSSMRPYLVLIFQAYGVPLDANWASVSSEIPTFSDVIEYTIISLNISDTGRCMRLCWCYLTHVHRAYHWQATRLFDIDDWIMLDLLHAR